MLIYRIEHDTDGKGPYIHTGRSYTNEYQLEINLIHCDSTHPGLWSDCGTVLPFRARLEEYYCGFTSVTMLIEWFSDWLEIFEENGLTLVVYSCPDNDVICGEYQTAFIKKNAHLIDRHYNIIEYATNP